MCVRVCIRKKASETEKDRGSVYMCQKWCITFGTYVRVCIYKSTESVDRTQCGAGGLGVRRDRGLVWGKGVRGQRCAEYESLSFLFLRWGGMCTRNTCGICTRNTCGICTRLSTRSFTQHSVPLGASLNETCTQSNHDSMTASLKNIIHAT